MKKLFLFVIIILLSTYSFSQTAPTMVINKNTGGAVIIPLTEILNITFQNISVSGGMIFTRSPLSGGGDIYKMNSDGSGQTKLIDRGGREDNAKLSPDLSKLVFSSTQSSTGAFELFVANSDGSNQVQLTSSAPQFGNTNGIFRSNTKIWYGNAQTAGYTEIYEINTDGTGNTKLTNFSAGGKQGDVFDFNSDKSKILYYKQNSSWSPTGEIYTANIDLTDNSTNDGGANISPNGAKVVFHRCEGSSGYNPPFNIFVMNIDGTQVNKLTNGSGNQYLTGPKFSPDGSKIAYSFNNGTQTDIYVMNLDGTNPINLTNTPDQNEILTDWK
jgi:Tol biopolymer transport system component